MGKIDKDSDSLKLKTSFSDVVGSIINWDDVSLRKISVNLAGHATSFSLEKPFLDVLQAEAKQRQLSFAQFVRIIDDQRPTHINLSQALRLVAFAILQKQSKTMA